MKLRLRHQLTPTATTNAQIYVDFKGEEANSSSIDFLRKVFNIAWVNDKILSVSTMEFRKCAKCLAGTFEGE